MTKGFELMNELLENYKLYAGRDFGNLMGGDMLMDRMDFGGRPGFDEEMMMSMSASKQMKRFMH